MVYSDFSIEQLKQRLFLKAMKNSTPKKYAGDMLEAAEVIQQLQAKIKRLETSQDQAVLWEKPYDMLIPSKLEEMSSTIACRRHLLFYVRRSHDLCTNLVR